MPSATYTHQLVAFREAIVSGTPFPTTAEDGLPSSTDEDLADRDDAAT